MNTGQKFLFRQADDIINIIGNL